MYKRASDFWGDFWFDAPTAITSGGQYASLAVVNGNPAISYYQSGDLKYVRSSDSNGVFWAAAIPLDTNGVVGSYTSLAIVNGAPAVSYYDYSNSALKCISRH
ncbi:MAG: hypothetical protein GKR87_11640 [Kiritimatiellae bacterium]|nr:hypothetical protein [Kiritimatiellia bacterium]